MRPPQAIRRALVVLVGTVLGVAPAAAQTPKATPWELSVTGVYARGLTLAPVVGNETEASGQQVPLFSAQNQLDPGAGLEASLARHLIGLFSAEVEGAWTRATYRTTVTSDFESAPLGNATNAASDYRVTGAVVVTFARHARLQYFARVGGGWCRELSEDQISSADGRVVLAGGGVKYWWGSRGAASHWGLRADVGALGRSGGLGLTSTMRFAPAASAGLSLRF